MCILRIQVNSGYDGDPEQEGNLRRALTVQGSRCCNASIAARAAVALTSRGRGRWRRKGSWEGSWS